MRTLQAIGCAERFQSLTLPALGSAYYDEHGEHQALSCAELLAKQAAQVELVTPARLVGEELGAINFAIQGELEQARLQQQEVELNARNIQRQVEELGGDVTELAEGLPEEAATGDWEEQLERLHTQITRLEPVNLAAIQEFEFLLGAKIQAG